MKVIVGNMNPKLREFIRKSKFTSRVIVINKMCNVKTIKGDVDIFIPFGLMMKNGLIQNTEVNVAELIMSLNVKTLYFGNSKNKDEFEKYAKLYDINLVFLDTNTFERGIDL